VSVAGRGDRVEIAVADDGVGISPAHLGRVFERFYRVDAGRSRELGGTGLGLSIVKHLVELMGGTVGVESEPGKGARFTLRLIAAEPRPQPSSPELRASGT
jgi:two-component system phosphate regulon sensor histidine kinase PhoR